MSELPGYWITVDPGEDTGWAEWTGSELAAAHTDKGWEFVDILHAHILEGHVPDVVVCEDWKIYPWKANELAWDGCRTARFIGAITFLCRVHGIEFVLQPAKIKEVAQKAGADHLYSHPLHENRHQNDAIQHGVFYLATRGTAIEAQPLPDEGGGGESA